VSCSAQLPAFGIIDTYHSRYDHKVEKFAFPPSHKFDETAVMAFCQKFVSKQLPRYYRSEKKTSQRRSPGIVAQVVWDLFHTDVYKSQSDVLLMLYQPHTLHQRKENRLMEIVAEMLQSVTGFMVAKMDISRNHYDEDKFPANFTHFSAPGHLYLVSGDRVQPFVEHANASSPSQVVNWLRRSSKVVGSQWSTVLTTKKVQNEKTEKHAARRNIRRTAQPVENVTADGGILKQVIESSTGNQRPKAGNLLKFHITERSATTGEVFDTSHGVHWLEDPREMVIGLGDIEAQSPCHYKALMSMKEGEDSVFWCEPTYAYANVTDIPAGRRASDKIECEIHLVSLEGYDQADVKPRPHDYHEIRDPVGEPAYNAEPEDVNNLNQTMKNRREIPPILDDL